MVEVMHLGTKKYPKLILFNLRAHHLEMIGKVTGLDKQLNHKTTLSC